MRSSRSEEYQLLRHEVWDKNRTNIIAFWIKLGSARTKNVLLHFCNTLGVTET